MFPKGHGVQTIQVRGAPASRFIPPQSFCGASAAWYFVSLRDKTTAGKAVPWDWGGTPEADELQTRRNIFAGDRSVNEVVNGDP